MGTTRRRQRVSRAFAKLRVRLRAPACSVIRRAVCIVGDLRVQSGRLSQILRHFIFACLVAWVVHAPAAFAEGGVIVNDVTQLNPITVSRVVAPRSIAEVAEAVRNAKGHVSIGGGRYSMGGQTATEGAVQLDMRAFNRILAFEPDKKDITVESGATWRQIQERIDPYNLSVKIMQTYADFTVGGSLSVNVHGRYIGYGPLVLSVKRIGIVLADGKYLNASPAEHAEIFYGAIGGYGGLGVITDATLALAKNVKVHRVSRVMPFVQYKKFFVKNIRNNPRAVFHNADIYPDAYDTVRSTTYLETVRPLTRADRLIPKDRNYWIDQMLFGAISGMPGGKLFREYVVDPILFADDRVTWRNYEASYTTLELEPASRRNSTYVLQEYFVPLKKIDEFVPRMAHILKSNHVNVINISIRHARRDPGTLLAWARQEVFSFVVYYKQGTDREDQQRVRVWTRQLIDAAIALDGSYYLPYQIHATDQQFKAAYPDWKKFFALKRKIDPANKFSNKLWDAYYSGNAPLRDTVGPVRAILRAASE